MPLMWYKLFKIQHQGCSIGNGTKIATKKEKSRLICATFYAIYSTRYTERANSAVQIKNKAIRG